MEHQGRPGPCLWWELRTLEKLNHAVTPLRQPGEDQEAAVRRVNQAVYEEHREQPAAELRAACSASFVRIMEGLQGYTDSHVLANLESIAGDPYGHYPEHIEAIRLWLTTDPGQDAGH